MTLYFLADSVNLNSTAGFDLVTMKHNIVQNGFPFQNSQIMSATFQTTKQEYLYQITLSMLVMNKYHGIVFSGTITGYLGDSGIFTSTSESWGLKYDFLDTLSYNILKADGMHMFLAIQTQQTEINAPSTYYKMICVDEHRGLLQTQTISKQLNFNNEIEAYENDDLQFVAYVDTKNI